MTIDQKYEEFDFIQSIIYNAGDKVEHFKKSLLTPKWLNKLVSLSSEFTVYTVNQVLDQKHKHALSCLSESKAKYNYLKALLDTASWSTEHSNKCNPVEWKADVDTNQMFLEQIARYEPSRMATWLQQTDTYNLEQALVLVKRHKIRDAQVFLLERIGDVKGALDLYMEDIKEILRRVRENDQFDEDTSKQLRSLLGNAARVCQANTKSVSDQQNQVRTIVLFFWHYRVNKTWLEALVQLARRGIAAIKLVEQNVRVECGETRSQMVGRRRASKHDWLRPSAVGHQTDNTKRRW